MKKISIAFIGLVPLFFLIALSAAGQVGNDGNAVPSTKSAGQARALSQGASYTVMTCRDLAETGKNFDNESAVIRDAHILKTDFYDPYRRQIFVRDRTGTYERIFVELYSPLSALLEKMEGRTGTLYGAVQRKPSFGSFIVTRWEAKGRKR